MAVRSDPESYTFSCASRGYGYYQKNWTPKVGEKLLASLEPDNVEDENAIALKLTHDGDTVGYLPREISKCTADVIKLGGRVMCKVTDAQIRVGKGPEVPIRVTVTIDQSSAKELKRYKKLVNKRYKEPDAIVPWTLEDVTKTAASSIESEVSQAESTGNPTYATKTETEGEDDQNDRYTCQVFYKTRDREDEYRVKVIFGFSGYCFRRNVARYFRDIRGGPTVDFDFESVATPVSIRVLIEPQGWHIRMIPDRQRVYKVPVDAYIGEGEPPYCAMFVSCKKQTGGNRLTMEVILDGTIPITTIDNINTLVDDDMCVSGSDTDSDTDTDSDNDSDND